MKKYLVPVLLVIGLFGAAAPTQAASSSAALTSITKYVDQQSVFARYYAQYLQQYGKEFTTKEDAFRSFCKLLQDSDLLAIEIVESGIPANQIYPALDTLRQTDLNGGNAEAIRNAMHAVDYVLESIEFSFTRNHRGEFRREVLAQVPPLSFSS